MMITTNIDHKKVYISEELIDYLEIQKQNLQQTKAFLPITTEDVNAFLLDNRKELFGFEDYFKMITRTHARTQNGGPEIDSYSTKEKEHFSLESTITESLVKSYEVSRPADLKGKVLGIYALPLDGKPKFVFGVYAKN